MKLKQLQDIPEKTIVKYDGDIVRITYRRPSPEWMDLIGTMPLRQLLAKVMLHWDITNDDDTVFEPRPATDREYYEPKARERRYFTESAALVLALSPDDLERDGVKAQLDKDREALRKKIDKESVSDDELTQAYVDEWEAHFKQVPQVLLNCMFKDIMEDISPGKVR